MRFKMAEQRNHPCIKPLFQSSQKLVRSSLRVLASNQKELTVFVFSL